ncbi:hypothetical protein BD626DRAFT_489612 [Schizophyllum amplum]|uniref:Uncharacterized protein n=1 Tax=Schizophyllum amplum TaxID=97359 RepID=A0A550CIQ9_9AGAR|nr:hypothetical protein BD626DRAFT_489612 [Auriculariopsis ampla]
MFVASVIILVQFATYRSGVFAVIQPAGAQKNIHILSHVACKISLFIGDAIVVWRAWMVWTHSRIVQAILASCLISSLAGCTANFVLMLQQQIGGTVYPQIGGTGTVYPQIGGTVYPQIGGTVYPQSYNLILILPLLATNVCTTGLIGLKAWLHQRETHRAISGRETHKAISGRNASPALRILLLLCESGIVYCVLWTALGAVYATLDGEDTTSVAAATFLYAAPTLAGIYPTVIIIVATARASGLRRNAGGVGVCVSGGISGADWSGPQFSSDRFEMSAIEFRSRGEAAWQSRGEEVHAPASATLYASHNATYDASHNTVGEYKAGW